MISLEYILGFLLTIGLLAYFFVKNKEIMYEKEFTIKYRQSHIFELIKPSINFSKKRIVNRQSDEHEKKINIKVLIMDDKAFWIKNNAVYTAPVENDEIIKGSATQVDIMGMDEVELGKIMFIIDQLTERQDNDRGNPGVE